MRSAPTLKIWMTPFASVAMLEKLALLKIALCRAPTLSSASLRRTSVTTFPVPGSPSRIALCSIFVPFLNCDWPCFVFSFSAVGARERRSTLARHFAPQLRDRCAVIADAGRNDAPREHREDQQQPGQRIFS